MFNDPILFIGAHPDDIDINAGGTVRKLLSEGKEIHMIVLTYKEDPTRYQETKDSIEVLQYNLDIIGYTNYIFIDTKLYSQLDSIIKELDKYIKYFNIKTIFTHYPYDTHNDHVTAAQASIAAGRNVDNIIYYKCTFPSGRSDIPFNPNLTVKLSEDEINTKLLALKCHKSQITKYGNEDYIDVIKDIAKGDAWVYGGFHGYAELFQISRMKI